MERIKVVLLFNEEDERQREVGNFLKSQQRCKTALITELIYDWLKRKERGASGETMSQQPDKKFLESVKSALMDDGQFLNRLIEKMTEGNMECFPNHNDGTILETEHESDTEEQAGLDMDEEMLLMGMALFENQ